MRKLTPLLRQRAGLLIAQLTQELRSALSDLGREAGLAWQAQLQSNDRREAERAVQRGMRQLNLQLWLDSVLYPLLRNHMARVAMDTQRELGRELGLDLALTDAMMNELDGIWGGRFSFADIEPQVEDAMRRALARGFMLHLPMYAITELIVRAVPEGRFRYAGVQYRAELIARNETMNLQRRASILIYEQAGIQDVMIVDGIYGPPRSDAACIERDGELISIADARGEVPFHPMCTLGFDPA